jgi:histidinol-phosphatase (PHP family)
MPRCAAFWFRRIHPMTAPILYDSHMHTPLCKHASGQPGEYAARAAARGLKGIIMTCHNPTEGDRLASHVRMRVAEFDAYSALVESARDEWQGRVDVRLGLECDYLPGQEIWLEALLPQADLEFVLGSVHPQLSDYRNLYLNGSVPAFQRTYFQHLAQAAETGLFDCLSHPDLVKNDFPEQWDLQRLMPDIERALDRIAATGVAMELNTSGLIKRLPEMNPAPPILTAMLARGIPVVIGSDSHLPQSVGGHFERGLDLLAEIGYTEVSVFLNRRRHAIPIPAARASLRPA